MALALMLGVAMFLLGGFVAPSSASAFVGESSVLNPAKTDLTSPAKTIIENPTFLTENVGEAASFGSVSEESAAAAVFEGAGLLPSLGAVVSFGVGTVIGSEICHVIGIEGCWYFHSDGADPAVGGSGSWTFLSNPPSTVYGMTYTPRYQWFYRQAEQYSYTWSGVNGVPKEGGCGLAPPTSRTGFYASSPIGSEDCKGVVSGHSVLMRDSMTNRSLEYHATDDPGISNYQPGGKPYEAPKEWSEKLASELKGQSGNPAGRVGEKIASKIAGSGVANPYATVKVPDCSGLKLAPCEALLEELDLVPEVTELDWDDAVIEELDTLDPEKTREEESERVITILPAPDELVVPGTSVNVETNPDKEHMPEFLPEPDKQGGEDGEGEDEDEYKKRLAPIFIPHVETLDDGTLDPDVGPNSVSHTSPGPYHRFDPSTEHDVNVEVNPSTAPLVGASPGGSCDATVGAIDWAPLNQPLGSRFPFGVFAFFVAWIGEWTASEVPPEWEVTVLPPMLGGEGLKIKIDLESMGPVAEVVRVAFVFVSFVGLLWFLGTAAMKVQGDTS